MSALEGGPQKADDNDDSDKLREFADVICTCPLFIPVPRAGMHKVPHLVTEMRRATARFLSLSPCIVRAFSAPTLLAGRVNWTGYGYGGGWLPCRGRRQVAVQHESALRPSLIAVGLLFIADVHESRLTRRQIGLSHVGKTIE